MGFYDGSHPHSLSFGRQQCHLLPVDHGANPDLLVKATWIPMIGLLDDWFQIGQYAGIDFSSMAHCQHKMCLGLWLETAQLIPVFP
jgi:hypothetical protein